MRSVCFSQAAQVGGGPAIFRPVCGSVVGLGGVVELHLAKDWLMHVVLDLIMNLMNVYKMRDEIWAAWCGKPLGRLPVGPLLSC